MRVRSKPASAVWRESVSESRTETALPARGLSGLQAAEQWQETSAWNFSLPAGMRALIQDLVAPRRPAVNRDVTASFLRAASDRPGEGGQATYQP